MEPGVILSGTNYSFSFQLPFLLGGGGGGGGRGVCMTILNVLKIHGICFTFSWNMSQFVLMEIEEKIG